MPDRPQAVCRRGLQPPQAGGLGHVVSLALSLLTCSKVKVDDTFRVPWSAWHGTYVPSHRRPLRGGGRLVPGRATLPEARSCRTGRPVVALATRAMRPGLGEVATGRLGLRVARAEFQTRTWPLGFWKPHPRPGSCEARSREDAGLGVAVSPRTAVLSRGGQVAEREPEAWGPPSEEDPLDLASLSKKGPRSREGLGSGPSLTAGREARGAAGPWTPPAPRGHRTRQPRALRWGQGGAAGQTGLQL